MDQFEEQLAAEAVLEAEYRLLSLAACAQRDAANPSRPGFRRALATLARACHVRQGCRTVVGSAPPFRGYVRIPLSDEMQERGDSHTVRAMHVHHTRAAAAVRRVCAAAIARGVPFEDTGTTEQLRSLFADSNGV
jgi:hypothetical protein